MPIGKGDDGLSGLRAQSCASCGAALAAEQRYCLECGARHGPVPPAFAKWLSVVQPEAAEATARTGAAEEVEGAALAAAALTEVDGADADDTLAERFMPEPRSAAIAVMALLAFGVVIGAATGPIARSAGLTPIVLEMGSSKPPVEEIEPEVTAEAPVEEAAATPEATTAALPSEPPAQEESGSVPTPKPKLPPEFPEEPGLPTVEHVFLIVLGDHGFEEGFGTSSPAPYLSQTLRAKGELLSNYYAVTQGDLANEVALLSGQGPTPATASGCPTYADVSPGTVSTEEQVLGEGCVYPSATQTLPGQLAAAKKSWKAYFEDSSAPPAPVAACGAYATARNPLAYFHSLLEEPACAERNVSLNQLETDLKSEKTTPALSYLVANACHDGSEEPCEPGQPAGLAATQPFLEKVVPEIEASMAYKKSGLIAITFAQAPQAGPHADASACCGTPAYPNLPPAAEAPATSGPVKPSGGGGRVGLLLLSPFVEANSSSETYYNHFSLLLSIEEAFKLKPIGYAANPALAAFDSTVYNQGS